MSELRQNLATKEWIILATERARRPEDFAGRRAVPEDLPPHDPDCPFCEGSEAKTPPEVFASRAESSPADGPGWQVRVIPNKFAALSPPTTLPANTERTRVDCYMRMLGIGRHEVVIETPQHNLCLGRMPVADVERVLLTYRHRYLALDAEEHNELIIIFRNHGPQAGTSLAHPHSQIVATPVVPSHVRNRMLEAMRYYDALGRCVYCDIIESELGTGTRLVGESRGFIAFHPFASAMPYETWIMPREHRASFGSISPAQVRDLAGVLRSVLGRLHRGLGDPAYNFVIHTAPEHSSTVPHYHWHLQIMPRLTTQAGFEIGSGIAINIAMPEDTARFLREVPEE